MSTPTRTAPRPRAAIWGICLGFFLVLLDATIVNVALPAMGRGLTLGLSAQQWAINLFTLPFAALTINAGVWGDRWGARRVYLVGLAAFTAGTVLCGCAVDTWQLFLGRVIQGCGAAAVVPCSLALISQLTPEGPERARALGAWGGISGIGLAAGPVLGGVLVESVGWRGVFFVAVPITAVVAVLILRAVPPSPRAVHASTDFAGQLAALVALTALSGALMRAPGAGLDAIAVSLTLIGGVAAIGFVAVERRVRTPMVPLGIFRRRSFSVAVAIGFLFNLGLYGALFCLAIMLQDGRGLSSATAGLVILPMAAMIAVCATLSGRIAARRGPRLPMLLGLGAGAIGSGMLAVLGASAPVGVVVAGCAVFGMIGLAMPAMTSVALSALSPDRAGLSSGVLNAARQAGGLVGVALLGAILGGGGGSHPTGIPIGAGVPDGPGAPGTLGFPVALAIVALGYLCAWIMTLRLPARERS